MPLHVHHVPLVAPGAFSGFSRVQQVQIWNSLASTGSLRASDSDVAPAVTVKPGPSTESAAAAMRPALSAIEAISSRPSMGVPTSGL